MHQHEQISANDAECQQSENGCACKHTHNSTVGSVYQVASHPWTQQPRDNQSPLTHAWRDWEGRGEGERERAHTPQFSNVADCCLFITPVSSYLRDSTGLCLTGFISSKCGHASEFDLQSKWRLSALNCKTALS